MRITKELRCRTKALASSIIRIFISLPRKHDEINILAKQMLRSGTSVAAHAREASRARSNLEFCSKVDGLLQEADETQLWIELLIEDCQQKLPELKSTHHELDELIAVFTSIVSRTRRSL